MTWFRWNQYVLKRRDGELDVGVNSAWAALWQGTINKNITFGSSKRQSRGKKQIFDLIESIHAAEASCHSKEHPAHGFEVQSHLFTLFWYLISVLTLSDVGCTRICFIYWGKIRAVRQLSTRHSPRFQEYTLWIWEIPCNNSTSGFNFLLPFFSRLTSFQSEDIPYPSPPPAHLPKKYGSYHQLYRLDGELIAMAVLDILPYCVSSVYFIYGKAWEQFSFGKVCSPLVSYPISLTNYRSVHWERFPLAREIHEAGVFEMRYLYMGEYFYGRLISGTECHIGFYIQSCQKWDTKESMLRRTS